MRTEFRKAALPKELRSLVSFDRKVFPKSDAFGRDTWMECTPYWMLINGVKVGCCAFQSDVDFQYDFRTIAHNPKRVGSLYINSTGILPSYQGRGFGRLLKAWQISFARYQGFTRIVTNTRRANEAMIKLNRKFGFRIVRTLPGYYQDPPDSVVVMELLISKPHRVLA